MQQHLQRLDGVAKAEVSLRDGHVTITPKSDGVLDPYQVLKATYDSGVSVTEMELSATGTIEKSGDGLAIRLNPRQALDLAPGEKADALKPLAEDGGAGQSRATVKGIFYRKPLGSSSKQKSPTGGLKLEVTESHAER